MTDPTEATAREFSRLALPCYHGPFVKVQINPGNYQYTISEPLLCKNSAYFSSIFSKNSKESQNHSQNHIHSQQRTVVLDTIEGVVSPASFEAFLQWIYLRRVKFDTDTPQDQISAAIELARLADMCVVPGLGEHMARYIQDILIANPEPEPEPGPGGVYDYTRRVNMNTYVLSTEHIVSASFLPDDHAVRRVLAAASVEGYLRYEHYKFAREVREYPSYAADVLGEVRRTLNTLDFHESTVEDPVSGRRFMLNNFYVV